MRFACPPRSWSSTTAPPARCTGSPRPSRRERARPAPRSGCARSRSWRRRRAIAANPDWVAHREATGDVPVATLDDLEWADGFAFGTPTRYGAPAAQLKQFIDSASALWHEGKLADKGVTTFVSSAEQHGGQESTILSLTNVFYHWGSIIVPLGYTDDVVYAAGGNPYGTSWPAGFPSTMPDDVTLACARYQGGRLARFSALLAADREALTRS